ncbi:hypothetical protein Csa_020979 [Cucumis sativus]|uniref:Uncharacterized protein n=1 Tax=Cucumis sativus TaxID=3659 RepID=A0A0A0KBN7_CUCSA|nr:hypothetical protein Csa_020979 [Cucumis sativus]
MKRGKLGIYSRRRSDDVDKEKRKERRIFSGRGRAIAGYSRRVGLVCFGIQNWAACRLQLVTGYGQPAIARRQFA